MGEGRGGGEKAHGRQFIGFYNAIMKESSVPLPSREGECLKYRNLLYSSYEFSEIPEQNGFL
jgi:hypothetical protein